MADVPSQPTLTALDSATRALVRAAAAIAASDEVPMRQVLTEAVGVTPLVWMEELILQSYLFCGFPRTLNAMREWRRVADVRAPATDPGAPPRGTDALAQWRTEGEGTCNVVYGRTYERLRHNIRELHPALDEWMITDGYGKVLSRPGLDLLRRELCVVAACAAAQHDRQLHAHLHGAMNAGATREQIDGVLDAVDGIASHDVLDRARRLWNRVGNQP